MTKRALLLTALALLASTQATMAGPVKPIDPIKKAVPQAQEEKFSAWFVELKEPPRADGGSQIRLATEKQEFRNQVKALGIKMKVRFSYDTLFNGFSVEVDGRGLSKIRPEHFGADRRRRAGGGHGHRPRHRPSGLR
jgi:hypothetical protein